jgi:AcrR family transcriptional regulator
MAKIRREGSLTRQAVLEAALRLIDQEGLEGFSMRKLGAALGVEAMSLYNHIESKDALFDGVIETLLLQIPYPERSNATPHDELWAFAHAYRAVLHAHPRVLPLVATRQLQTPASLAILERLLATIHRANVNGVHALYAVNSLAVFIIGHALLNVGTVPVAGIPPQPANPPVWQQLPADQYPTLHAAMPFFEQWNPDQEFDFGLQALLQSFLIKQ